MAERKQEIIRMQETRPSGAGILYSSMMQGDPTKALTAMADAFVQGQIMGVKAPGDAYILAMTCMCEQISPVDFVRTYHIIDGKPSMRADAMLAKFRMAGGKVKWHNLGDDDAETAEATFTFEGEDIKSTFTMKDAKLAIGDKLTKPGSAWVKTKSAMLRSRLITKVVRILAPELIAGVYTPDELDGIVPDDQNAPEKVAARQAELQQAAIQQPVANEAADVIVDVVATPATTPPVAVNTAAPDAPWVATPDDIRLSTADQRQDLFALVSAIGLSAEDTENAIKQKSNVSDVAAAPFRDVEWLIAEVTKNIAAQQAESVATS